MSGDVTLSWRPRTCLHDIVTFGLAVMLRSVDHSSLLVCRTHVSVDTNDKEAAEFWKRCVRAQMRRAAFTCTHLSQQEKFYSAATAIDDH